MPNTRKSRASSVGSSAEEESNSSSSLKKSRNTPTKATNEGKPAISSKKKSSSPKKAKEPQPEVSEEEFEDADDEEETTAVIKPKAKSLRSGTQESMSFFKLGSRMLNEGKASSKYLRPGGSGKGDDKDDSSSSCLLKSTWKRPSNAIERAAAGSVLYDGKATTSSQLRKDAKDERTKKTLGKGWFNAAPAEMTSELRSDMKIVQMRNYLDPKRFYKNPDKMKNVIGVGTVIEGPDEFTTQRLTKKERKQSLVGEILADKQIKDYTKRKYTEIQVEKEKNSRKNKKKKMGQRSGVGSGSRKIRSLY